MKIKTTLLLLLFSFQLFSQANIKKEDKQKETNNETSIVKQPFKGDWSIGLNVGVPFIVGDMETRFGYGASLTVQRSLSHLFALRFQGTALDVFGLDHSKYRGKYSNFKTRITDYTLQGVINLNNLSFYYKEPKVLFKIFAGGGFATKHSWINKYDKDGNEYNYDQFSGSSKETIKAVNDMTDNVYETIVKRDGNRAFIKNTTIMPSIVLGAGISFKLSKSLDLNLESRASFHHSDKLDAQKRGQATDWLAFSSIGLSYKFKSKNKAAAWTNPIYTNIENNDSKKEVLDLLTDVDNDGVIDKFDIDISTPPNVKVNTKGVAKDTDSDGVPDYRDEELFSPLHAEVNNKGVAIDTDKDGIADILDLEINSPSGSQVDSKGRAINLNTSSSSVVNNFSEMVSPVKYVFFDLNSIVVKEEFYPNLFELANRVKNNPSAQIQLTGYTDKTASRNYNVQLSKRRADAVEKILVDYLKVPKSKIVKDYYGEDNPLIDSGSDTNGNYINRRVEVKLI